MPTYNHEDFIAEAIESALCQEYYPLEIVIGDDGSTDATSEIIRAYASEYPEVVIPVISPHNTGIPANVNRIMDRCTGQYIAVLSADDVWLPGKLHRQIALMESDPEIVWCYADCEIFDSVTGATIGLSSEVHGLGRGKLVEGGVEVFFHRFSAIKSPTVVYRSSAIGDLRFDVRLSYGNDSLFDIELLAKGGKAAAINEPLARYRKHGGNITSSQRLHSRVLEEGLILHAIVEARYPELVSLANRRLRVSLLGDMIGALQVRDYKRADARRRSLASRGYRLKGIGVYLLYRLFSPHVDSLKESSLLRELARRYIYR
jgi:glycosyltransferase involved in cell wall biosynthesis